MELVETPYKHRPVYGLPASLLAVDGGSLAVLRLMKKRAALNREIRRKLPTSLNISPDLLEAVHGLLSKADLQIVSYYMSPGGRAVSFWGPVAATLGKNKSKNPKAPPTALVTQLLIDYEPDPFSLALETELMVSVCREWTSIKRRLEPKWPGPKGKMPFGVFMIWPRLVKDLRSWEKLDEGMKQRVAHAVFSVASIGETQWFIEEALSICPGLKDEFATLRYQEDHDGQSYSPLASDEIEPSNAVAANKQTAPAEAEKTTDAVELWSLIGQDLRVIEARWAGKPKPDLLEALIELGKRAAYLLENFPNEEVLAREKFETRLGILHERLRSLAAHGEVPWLGDTDIEAILARWRLAVKVAQSPDSVVELAIDAEHALDRVDTSVSALHMALAELERAQKSVQEIELRLSQPLANRPKLELSERRRQAKAEELEADSKRDEAIVFVWTSASPWGEPFDTETDYVEQLRSQVDEVINDNFLNLPQPALSEISEDLPLSEVSTDLDNQETAWSLPEEQTAQLEVDLETDDADGPALPECTGERDPASMDLLPDPAIEPSAPLNLTTEPSAVSAPSLDIDGGLDKLGFLDGLIDKAQSEKAEPGFTVEAGEQCSPAWIFLQSGLPVLAYHFARALESTAPELRVPPSALLRSVALARGLTASDGPLAIAVSESFLEIDSRWFEQADGPSNWHTALNLLLIAATLRPMIFAPAMGGAALASYRHLDRRYAALLELVRKVEVLSEPLTAFPIGPTALQSAADAMSQQTHLARLSKEATDWLIDRAPNKKIRFAPASKVWQHWLKPGEAIHRVMTLVARGDLSDRGAVKSEIDELSDHDRFLARLEDTDRLKLSRRGADIEAGAREHLWTATCEAVAVAKEWLSAANMLSDSGGRLRGLVEQLQAAFNSHAKDAIAELRNHWPGDDWGQVAAASRVLRDELEVIVGMFKQTDLIPSPEPQANELLARDLLLVSDVSVGSDWLIESDGESLLRSLRSWAAAPVQPLDALTERAVKGDLIGAESLLPYLGSIDDTEDAKQLLDKTKDNWCKDLQKEVHSARRSSEVGLAYGYLSDAERASYESELSAVELRLAEITRFDVAKGRIVDVAKEIEGQKLRRVDEARLAFERIRDSLSDEVARQIEAPLLKADVHTFNELVHRVQQGAEPWPEREVRRDVFTEFYPDMHSRLLEALYDLSPGDVVKLIPAGGLLGPISFELDGDATARELAKKAYEIWALAASRRPLARDGLRRVLEAIGVPVRSVDQDKANKAASWILETELIEDREVCPVPHFGSRAQGRYRVLVISDPLTPEDLIGRVGENTQQYATLVLLLARIKRQDFWSGLAKISKERHRSFLVLDESMLLFLLAQQGSRLATWFSIALPFTYSEPYDASAGFVPPEMFYGRSDVLESVKAQNGCFFIYGGRQLGKTALLRRAEKTFHDPSMDRYAVWVDTLAQGIGERRPSVDVWLSVSDRLRDLRISGLDIGPVNPAKSQTIDALLHSIKTFLDARPGRRILLLLDESDHFFEQDARNDSPYAETRRLKQLMDDTERRFKVVFAGLHNVLRTANTFNQPLGHLNEAVRIGPLSEEREIRAAEDLISRPIEAAGFEFEDRSLVMRILAQTNYYPSLIQLYCTQLLRHLRETKLRGRAVAGPRFKIAEKDIESVFAGRPLREAIRSKFRLTLQLDDRYEVIANAIALEVLASGFSHDEGTDWRTLWNDCRTSYWPEGFAKTTERDFLALMEEMVGLGVLSQLQSPERFSLKNPNVLLLLGSKQEIETTLEKEREPRIEFESAIFRPALGGRVDDPARNPLTYRQLDEVVQMRGSGNEVIEMKSSVLLVAANEAAGSANLLPGMRDQPGKTDSRLFVLLDRAEDKRSFTQELDRQIKKRVSDGITLIYVPAAVQWDAEWVSAARLKVGALRSVTSFVSVVFVADPERLWALSASASQVKSWTEPWLSVLPWDRGFVRKWLAELQYPTDSADKLESFTGYWGGQLESVARVRGGALDFAGNLDRLAKLIDSADWRRENRSRLTGGIEDAEKVLTAMAHAGDGVTAADLVEYEGLPEDLVARTLWWAEPLGLVVRQSGSGWSLNPFLKNLLAELGS